MSNKSHSFGIDRTESQFYNENRIIKWEIEKRRDCYACNCGKR